VKGHVRHAVIVKYMALGIVAHVRCDSAGKGNMYNVVLMYA